MSVEDRLVGLIRDSFPAGETVGVALSGGGDSTALLHLCRQAGFKVEAVTVDHRLRPESGDEAAAVAKGCAALGVRHEVRVWSHGEVTGNLMDAARKARMALIRDWARARGIDVVALGHTRDDQAETVLMGLARAAGLAGLSGMRREWDDDGMRFYRPLLGVGREELRRFLRKQKIAWIDDPTNEDERFTRVKARKALAALGPLGITAEQLGEVAANLSRAQNAQKEMVASLCAHLVEDRAGALWLHPALLDQSVEVIRQIVLVSLRWLSGAEHDPRRDALFRLLGAIDDDRDATLAGCRYRKGWLMREPRAVGGPVPVGQVWDRRWMVTGSVGEVRALGPEGLRQCPEWRATGLPRQVLEVTPGLWQGDRLIAAPCAGFGTATAKCVPGFNAFLLSH